MTPEQAFRIWEETGELSRGAMLEIKDDLMNFSESKLGMINAQIQTNPQLALMNLSKLTGFVNQILSTIPALIGHVANLVNLFGATLHQLGQRLNADGYSIGVSAPTGISFSLNFPI